MQHNPALPSAVIDAFHLMWGMFPESVTLVHKSKQVMAINKAGERRGHLKPGMNCAKLGNPEIHKGCKAHKAVASGEAEYTYMPLPDGDAIAFWIPLEGYPEFYVHFGVGISINYKTGQAKVMGVPAE